MSAHVLKGKNIQNPVNVVCVWPLRIIFLMLQFFVFRLNNFHNNDDSANFRSYDVSCMSNHTQIEYMKMDFIIMTFFYDFYSNLPYQYSS